MPYLHETNHVRLPRASDRRVKLTEADRAAIRANVGGLSQRALAKAYGVSRRLVTFILDPAKHEANLAARAVRGGWAVYYNRKRNTAAVRETRRHRQRVLG